MDFKSKAKENAKILVRRVKDIFQPGNWVMLTDVGVTRDMFTGQLLLFYKIKSMVPCCGFCALLPVHTTGAPVGASVMDATAGVKLCWRKDGVLVPLNVFI